MTVLGRIADFVLGEEIPPDELPMALPRGVTVRRNRWIPALGGVTGGMRGPASGVTLGGTILVHPEARIDEGLLVHELVHVEQWRADRLFAVKYVAECARRGYLGNRYEVEAYERERRFRAERTTARIP
ncbi:MAG TPA: hypothetical protein VF771_02795 [Longimicrobiaceae bacterium]